jgi:subtilisin family serine protease
MNARAAGIICGLSSVILSWAAPAPAVRDEGADRSLRLRSGRPAIRLSLGDALQRAAAGGRPANFHAFVALDSVPSAADRAGLAAAGVRLHGFVPPLAYHATIHAGLDPGDPRLRLVRGVHLPEPGDRLDPSLRDAGGDPGRERAIVVRLHDDVPLEAGRRLLRQAGAVIAGEAAAVNALAARAPQGALAALAARDDVAFIEEALPLLTPSNDGVRASLSIPLLWADPLRPLSGAGVDVIVYDQGRVDAAHPDFGGRVVAGDTAAVASHSTHVAGTLAGNGALSGGLYAGTAPAARLISYGLGGYNAGILMYSNPGDLQADFTGAIQTHGADLANLSVGSNVRINNYPCYVVGDYGATDALLDSIATGSLGPRLPIVVAGGNERPNPACDRVYATTTPPAGAKNLLSVGGSNSDDGAVLSFSAWGPTKDGRLKPEILAPGCEDRGDRTVTSTLPGATYGGFCGTSMAAPAATGVLAMLIEDERARALPDPSPALLRALAYHAAVDVAPPGPDYATGFGHLNPPGMLALLRGAVRRTGSVSHGERHVEAIVMLDPNTPFQATLVWDDPPAAAGAAEALVNDLDLRVYDPSGVRRFPWTLDPANPPAAASQTAEDHVNNVEQVTAPGMAGTWWVEVSGGRVASASPQPYMLLATSGAAAAPSDGSVSLDRDVYRCQDGATVTLRDTDLGGQPQTEVTVTSTTDPIGVTVVLTAGPGSIFTGQVTLGDQVAVAHGDALVVTSAEAGTARASVDCVPPVITGASITGVGSRGARLTWNTDEPADTRHAGQVLSHGRTLQHAVSLAPLAPCTAYAPDYASADAAGNLTAGFPVPFETLGEQVRLQDSFETGAPGWQNPAKGVANVIQWMLTSTASSSPVRSWTDSVEGNYRENSSNVLISPPFNLSFARDAVVRFMHRYAIEEGFDAGFVEYSLDGENWLPPVARFSGIAPSFVPAEVALPPETSGQPQVWLRFRLEVDNSISFDGWYLDDVQVVARQDCSGVEQLDVDLDLETGFPRLSWLPSPSATGYDVVRGTLPVAGVYGTCLATQVAGTTYDDVSAQPAISYFYLVAGTGGAGRGTLGTNSAGVERPQVPCP